MSIKENEKETIKVIACSGLLMFVPLSVFLFKLVDENAVYSFPFLGWGELYYDVYLNPLDPVEKNLQWVISLGTDRLCAIIYIICAAIRPDFSKCLRINLWYLYGVFESLRLLDHFLTYEQTPFREFYGYFLIIFQISYAFMYVFNKQVKNVEC